jgi:hypothetical protein
MKRHKVSVTVDGRSIRVSPDPLMMTSDDELHWSCSGPQRFSVEFEGAGPFANRKLGHDAATSPQKPKSRGRFKYTVALESDPSVRLDPEVVVGDPPSKVGP